MKKITVIRGDGIGPEVIDAALLVLEASGAKLKFEFVNAGESVMKEYGTPLPDEVIESIKKNKVALKGPVTTPIGSGFRSVNVELRKRLDLYANVRPTKTFEGLKNRYEKVDIVTIRENTEGLYAGVEHYIDREKSAAESIRIITRKAATRIAKFAFEYALKENRKKVTCVHKANILKATDGLFLECFREVAKQYSGKIEFEDKLIDNMCMQLVKKPEEYDVLLTPNLYGDIISDLCAGLVGGLGLAPGANIGDKYAIFEPVHGSAPKYAGKNKVNPTATILSAVMMLKYIGMEKEASRIMMGLEDVFREGVVLTYDLGGSAGTREFAEYLAEKVEE